MSLSTIISSDIKHAESVKTTRLRHPDLTPIITEDLILIPNINPEFMAVVLGHERSLPVVAGASVSIGKSDFE